MEISKKNSENLDTFANFYITEPRKQTYIIIIDKKLLNDVIEVLEGDHEDYTTLSEKFGHSKEIVKKSATIEERFPISTTPSPYILPWHLRQRTKIRRFQDFNHLHQSAQN